VKLRVFVGLKPGVLDPAGEAVKGGLHHLGYPDVASVRCGKFFDLEVADGPDAEARVAKMADQLLANPVIESYRVETIG
jgi:phosphoribosylformylglycinamidine synthase subunit PurS